MTPKTFPGAASVRQRASAVLVLSFLLTACGDKSAEESLADAKAHLANKNNSAALIELKSALQANPGSAEARLLLGKVLLDGGDARGVLTELTKAKEIGSHDDRLRPLIAQTLVARGEFAKAIADFTPLPSDSKAARADIQASLAIAYSASGNSAKALESIQSATADDPANTRAQLVRVRLVSAASGPAQGLAALEPVLERSPASADGWQMKGDLLNLTGKATEALAAYRKAIALDKHHVLAHVGAFHTLLGRKDLDGAKAEIDALRHSRGAQGQVQLLTALLALERNDLDIARDNAQLLLKSAPEDVRALHLAGVVAFRRGALLEAEEYLTKTLLRAPAFDDARLLLAQTQLRAGDSGKALGTLQPLLGDQTGNVSALSIAAEAYLQAGDAKRAQDCFVKITKLDPNDVPSRVALALSDVGRGSVEQGIASLRGLSAASASQAPDLALVSVFMQNKQWEQALGAIDTLERKDPKSAGPANLRGRVELVRGNKANAVRAFESALRLDPAYYPAAASLAALDIQAKDPKAAQARFEKILAVDPRSLSASLSLIGLRDEAGAGLDELVPALQKLVKQFPNETRPRLALIQLQLRRHQVKAALTTASEAAAAFPTDPGVIRHLAAAQAASGDTNQAVSSYNKLASLLPKAPEPLMLLARVYAARGESQASRQAMERALKLKPGYQPAQRALISNEIASGNFADALRQANEMKALFPDDPLVHSMIGDIAAVQKNWASAMLSYRAALKLLPQVDVAIKLHRVLIGAGRQAEARQFESQWLAEHPKDLKFLVYRADAALLLLQYDQALAGYLEALKLDPELPNALNNVAWLLHRNKDPKAIEYAEKAAHLSPKNPDYLDTLAQIQESSGQLSRAIEVQRQAVDLAPDLPMPRLRLAQYLAEAGQKAAAREHLQRLAALGDRFPQQAEVKRLLQGL